MRTARTTLVGLVAVTAALLTACGSSGSSADSPATPTSVAPPTTTAPTCTTSVPYRAGDDGYASYRIPAVVVTDRGTLLAFAEGRRNGTSDAGDIETLVRRSTDGGCTWTPQQVVTSVKGQNRNNPAPVFDPATKQVILLTLGRPDDVTEGQIRGGALPADQSMRIYQQTSSDDGATFTDPVEITEQIKKPEWRWYAVGPGHGIVLRHGDHKGRIVFGANHSVPQPPGSPVAPTDDQFLAAHAIYSDDNGKTWHIGFVQDNADGIVNGNETTAAELPDGSVYFSTRDQHGRSSANRADGTSTDGGASLTAPLAPQQTLSQVPVVEASLLQLAGDAHAPLLLSAPSNPSARKAMAIYASKDGGKTWKVAKAISDLPASYSDLVQLDDHTVGLLYETGKTTEVDTITFLRIPTADLAG